MRDLHQGRGRGTKVRCSVVARACDTLRIDTPGLTWCTADRVLGHRSVLFSPSSDCSFFFARPIEPESKSRVEKSMKRNIGGDMIA